MDTKHVQLLENSLILELKTNSDPILNMDKSCKDCIYSPACYSSYEMMLEYESTGNHCLIYSNQNDWVHLPCKVGDTISAIRQKPDGTLYWLSDEITKISFDKTGWTIKTKSKFYPIKQKDGCLISSISKYPYAMADYYIGSPTELKFEEANHEPLR